MACCACESSGGSGSVGGRNTIDATGTVMKGKAKLSSVLSKTILSRMSSPLRLLSLIWAVIVL